MKAVDALLQYTGTKSFTNRDITRMSPMTTRRITYFAEKKFIRPALRDTSGPGSKRVYSQRDVCKLLIVQSLIDVGGLSFEKVAYHSPSIDRLLNMDFPRPITLHFAEGEYTYLSSEELGSPVFKKGRISQLNYLDVCMMNTYHMKVDLNKVIKPLMHRLHPLGIPD